MKKVLEAPEKALTELYKARLFDDGDVPFNEYINRYNFIVVDGKPYANDVNSQAVKMYQQTKIADLSLVRLPDAIIVNDSDIIKNRYGHSLKV